jgi:hypothetical protein
MDFPATGSPSEIFDRTLEALHVRPHPPQPAAA